MGQTSSKGKLGLKSGESRKQQRMRKEGEMKEEWEPNGGESWITKNPTPGWGRKKKKKVKETLRLGRVALKLRSKKESGA